MEMHQLRYFVAVARTGTFSRAAAECRVAQLGESSSLQRRRAITSMHTTGQTSQTTTVKSALRRIWNKACPLLVFISKEIPTGV
jgi:hypothetical protein